MSTTVDEYPVTERSRASLPPVPDGAVMLTVNIQRFNPELDDVPHTESYRVPALPGDRLLKERYARVSIMDKGQRYNTDLLEAVELGFLLELAEVLVVGALVRTESRGGHAREDYPNRDDTNWMRHTMAYKQGLELTADIRLDYKPVVQTRYQPMERKY